MFSKTSLALIFISLAKVCFTRDAARGSFNGNALGLSIFNGGPVTTSNGSTTNLSVQGIAGANTIKAKKIRGNGGNISQTQIGSAILRP